MRMYHGPRLRRGTIKKVGMSLFQADISWLKASALALHHLMGFYFTRAGVSALTLYTIVNTSGSCEQFFD